MNSDIVYQRSGDFPNRIRSYVSLDFCRNHGLDTRPGGHSNNNWQNNLRVGMKVRTDYGGNFGAVYTIQNIDLPGRSVDLDRNLETPDGIRLSITAFSFPGSSIIPADIVTE